MKNPVEALDPIDVHVGGRIRELRGVNRMAASTLAKAADALGCDVADLFPKEGETQSSTTVQVMQEVQSLYEQMGPRQRDALLLTARAMVFGRA